MTDEAAVDGAGRPPGVALAALALILAVATLVMVRDIVIEPLWLDEAFSLAAGRDDFASLSRMWIYNDANPPLHALALHVLLSVWNDDRAPRWLSLACWFGLVAFYGTRVSRGRSSWAEAVVVLCSAAVPHYAVEGRAYAPCFVAGVVSVRLLHDALAGGFGTRRLLAAIGFAALAAGLHYFGYLVFGYVFLQLVLVRRWPPLPVAVAVVAAGGVLGVWLLFHGSWLAANGGDGSWIARNEAGDSALLAFVAYGGWPQVLALAGLIAAPFLARAALPADVKRGWAILLGFNLLVLALDRVTPLVVVRYFLPLLALALVLVAESLAAIRPGSGERPARIVLALYVVAFGATLVEQYRAQGRILSWEPQTAWVAARNVEALPVAFVLDDPVSLNLTRHQHERMANVFNRGGGAIAGFGSDAASVADLERFVAARHGQPFYLIRVAAVARLRRGDVERVWRGLDRGACLGSEGANAYGIACLTTSK